MLVIYGSELLRRRGAIGNETTRKIFHIAHALVIATWGLTINYQVIIIAEFIVFGIVFLARVLGLFNSVRAVKRLSWGEFFFPLAVIVLALAEPSKWIFVAAILHFGLADAAAALVGQRAKKYRYKVFNQQKSVNGTVAFGLVSLAITAFIIAFTPVGIDQQVLMPIALLVSFVATLAENISPYGSDNFTVPVVVTFLLVALSR